MNSYSSYVNSIFEISIESNEVDRFFMNSKAIYENIDSLMPIISNRMISFEKKVDFLKGIFVDKDDEMFLNWLLVITQDNNEKHLPIIIKKLIKKYNVYLGKENGVIWTTRKIDKEIIKKVEDTLNRVKNKKVYLLNQIDRELIGGVKLEINGEVWNYSIKHKIDLLTHELINAKIENKKGEKVNG